MTRTRWFIVLGGLAIVGLKSAGAVANARVVNDYEDLVRDLERQPRASGQPHAALDHARFALVFQRARQTDRWKPGGYMFDAVLWVVLGGSMIAFAGFTRGRTASR